MADFFFALGTIHLSTYLKTFKVGDIVDIKVGLFFFALFNINTTTLTLKALRVISIKFLLVISMFCKTEFS